MESFDRPVCLAVALVTVFAFALAAADGLGFGRLPGDVAARGHRVTVHFPVTTSLVVGALLTAVVAVVMR